MDKMDNKLKIFVGLAFGLAASSFLFYLKDRNQSIHQKIVSSLQQIKSAIELHFHDTKPDDLAKKLEEKLAFIEMFEEVAFEYCDLHRLAEELSKHPFFKELQQPNCQIALFNIEYTSNYLKKNSLDAVYQHITSISQKGNLIKQIQYNLSDNATKFMAFIFITFMQVLNELEEILTDMNQKHRLVQINFFLNLVLEFLEKALKANPLLANLVAVPLLAQTSSLPLNAKFGHQCNDLFYAHQLKDTDSNSDCKCLLFDLLVRYISLITPTLQKRIIALLVDHQIFQTVEHLTLLGNILLKNAFYMNSQISVDSMYYVADVSVLNHLIIQSTAHHEVRLQIAQCDALDTYFLYMERVLTQNNPKFWSRLLSGLIASHNMIYPLFADKESLKLILSDEKKTTSTLVHFLGILLIMETRDTYEITAQNDNAQMMDWLAANIDTLLASEVLSYLQLQFISQILKQENEQIPQLLTKSYLQCLRVTQNRRIQARAQKKKMFEVSAGLTKVMGYFSLSLIKGLPSKTSLEQVIDLFPFQDETEKHNIFTNMLRILFDLPTMNLHFLKYIQPKCQKISQEVGMSFNGYFTHILSAQTLSFDTFMMTLQMGLLFGKSDVLLGEIRGRLSRDLEQFETYKDFLTRDLILLVDLIENPYYCLNILKQQQNCSEQLSEIQISLEQRAAISIMKLNAKMFVPQLLDTLQLFIHIKELPKHILDLLDRAEDGQVSLRKEYSLNFPYLSLQKDMESVNLYLQLGEIDLFDELLYSPDSFPFLKEIRQSMYRSSHFLQLIKDCAMSQNNNQILVWLAKLLYYGKQTLLIQGAGKNVELEQLFEEDCVKQFISKLEEKHEKLWKYLCA